MVVVLSAFKVVSFVYYMAISFTPVTFSHALCNSLCLSVKRITSQWERVKFTQQLWVLNTANI